MLLAVPYKGVPYKTYYSGYDRRKRTIRSVLNGQSVLFYHNHLCVEVSQMGAFSRSMACFWKGEIWFCRITVVTPPCRRFPSSIDLFQSGGKGVSTLTSSRLKLDCTRRKKRLRSLIYGTPHGWFLSGLSSIALSSIRKKQHPTLGK